MEVDYIKRGDCLELMKELPDECIDLIVTDPPYRITARGNGGNSGGMFQKKEVNNGKVFANNDIDIVDWLPELHRVLKNDTHCYIMTNNKNIGRYLEVINKSKFHYVKCLIWVKDNKIMGQTYMSQFEYVIMVRKGSHKKINNCGQSDVLCVANKKQKNEKGKTIHDTEKPIELMKILIENSTREREVVLDPFMGIGSTCVAATNTNRHHIGYELDEKYFEVAQKRIEEAKTRKENENNV